MPPFRSPKARKGIAQIVLRCGPRLWHALAGAFLKHRTIRGRSLLEALRAALSFAKGAKGDYQDC